MCKYCDGLKKMWKQYKELDSKYGILSQCNCNDDSDYFVWCDMQNLLHDHAILITADYGGENGNTYYFANNTSFNPVTDQDNEHTTSFNFCPMCGAKIKR